ncbi:MAG: GNAT family N-acetyltransferase [Clostridia bacterium]|nr:GNAT family N-acetyltransferase [Clostridia bacterium]
MQENRNYDFLNLDWDTQYFGFNSCKVILKNELKKQDIKDLDKMFDNYSFITIVNNNNNNRNNLMISKFDLFLADVNVQFNKRVEFCENCTSVIISNNCFENNEMLNIAKNSYKYSRFLNDSNLDFDKAHLLYYNWLKNSFNNEKKYIASYNQNESCLGYCLFHFEDDNCCIIELIAVNNDSFNQGIGSKIIKTVENYCFNNNISFIKVGTQLANIEAQNFYIKNGFKISNYNSIYHMWRNK